MHNYNPPIKYSYKTRIGNWSEEWELEETKRKDYMRNKQSYKTNGSVRQKQLVSSYQSASLTYSKDGFYHFGDHVMLYNGKTGGFLAADIFTNLSNTEEIYEVSTAKDIHACARAVFILERVSNQDGFGASNTLHYGQPFRVRLNPLLLNKPGIYLHSEPVSMTKYSKVSRMQEVTFTLKQNQNTVWILEHPNPNVRFEADGENVRVDDNLLVKHQMTNQWLASDTKTISNSFGKDKEFEVMVNNFFVNSKSQNLKNELSGKTTVDIPSKAQTVQNLWLFVTASDPSQEFDETLTKMTYTKGPLLQKIKFHLTEKGIFGIRFISKVYKHMDVNKTRRLDYDDFRWGMQSARIFLNEEEMNVLYKEYDIKKQGLVDYLKFLQEIKPKLSEKRLAIIKNSYSTIKKLLGDNTTLEEIAKIFDAERHPEVYTKVKTAKECFAQFVASWDNIAPDYKVTFEEFLDYFSDISAMIPKDDHFEFLMISVFHI